MLIDFQNIFTTGLGNKYVVIKSSSKNPTRLKRVATLLREIFFTIQPSVATQQTGRFLQPAYTWRSYLFSQLLQFRLHVAVFALQLGADSAFVLQRRLDLLEGPGEHLLGLVELVQLTLGLLQLLREVGRLGLGAALGAVQFLNLALRLVELRQLLGDLRLQVLYRLLRGRLR